jgi:Tol biopolymer transport system component
MENIPIIGMSLHEDGSFNALGMLGAYELSINPDNNTAELIAKRTSAIGESYVISGIGFFTISPCSTCLKIKSIELGLDGDVVLSFLISHPFTKGDILKPPSAINRLDLDVFDVALIIAPLESTPAIYGLTGTSAYTDICIKADGFTTELNEIIEDSSALPYYLVIDDSIESTSTYNLFEMGTSDVEFDAVFNLNSGNLDFDLYLTMGYGWSAMKPDRLEPQYYNPEFNRKAAWKVDVTPPEGAETPAIGNTWDDADDTTPYNVTVEVYDWQIGANIDPELTNPTDIYAASGVSNVSVEIPGMNNALQSVATAGSGAGTHDDPLVYTVPIANENLLEEGEYIGLVKVTDERAVGTIGDRDFIIDSPDGVVLENFNLPEFATYQTFTATVVSGVTSTVEIILPNGGESFLPNSHQDITWTTTDYTGTIKLEYSKDEFVADINEIIASTEDDGVFDWQVPDDPSCTVRVRASLVDDPAVYDDSDGDFCILIETIVYYSGAVGGRQIFSIDPLGVGTPEQWTNDVGWIECPKISPCGKYILYTRAFSSGFNGDIMIIDVATGIATEITQTGYDAIYGDFSHDGTKIVCAMGTDIFALDLWTMDYDGSNIDQLTSGADSWAPEYKWDDSAIYYEQFADAQIYIYDIGTSVITPYTDNGTWNNSPHGNPENTQIAWATAYTSGCRCIYISPIGSWNPPDKIINFISCIRSPGFSPDGTKLVIDYGSYEGTELGVYDLSDDSHFDITNNSCGDYQGDWWGIIPH